MSVSDTYFNRMKPYIGALGSRVISGISSSWYTTPKGEESKEEKEHEESKESKEQYEKKLEIEKQSSGKPRQSKQYQKEDVNFASFYNETMIVQVWDNYVKIKKLKYFYCDESQSSVQYSSSLFDIKRNMKNAGLLITKEHELYRGVNGSSISIANVVNHEGGHGAYNAITHNINVALKQILLWNEKHKDKLIIKHKIIFPYHPTDLHWNLGVLELDLSKENIQAIIHAFDPYGGGFVNTTVENAIRECVKQAFSGKELIFKKEDKNLGIHRKQQHDGSSCGPITAENGKDIIDKGFDHSRMKAVYEPGAIALRKGHLNEVQDEDFFRKQWIDDRRYTDGSVKGDKAIRNKDKVINTLISGINALEQAAIQEFTAAFLALKEVPEVLKRGTRPGKAEEGDFLKRLRELRAKEIESRLNEQDKADIAKLCPEGKYIKHYLECIIVQDPYMGAVRNIKALLNKHLIMLNKIGLRDVIFVKEKNTFEEGAISLLEEIAVSHSHRIKKIQAKPIMAVGIVSSARVITFKSYPGFSTFPSVDITETDAGFVFTSTQITDLQQLIARINMELSDEGGLKKHIVKSKPNLIPKQGIVKSLNEIKTYEDKYTNSFVLSKDLMLCIIAAIDLDYALRSKRQTERSQVQRGNGGTSDKPNSRSYKDALAGKAELPGVVQSDADAKPIDKEKFAEKSNPTVLLLDDEPKLWQEAEETLPGKKQAKVTSTANITGKTSENAKKKKTAKPDSDSDSEDEDLFEDEENEKGKPGIFGGISAITRIPEKSVKVLEGLSLSYLPDPQKLKVKDNWIVIPRLPVARGEKLGTYTGTVDLKMNREGFGIYKTEDGSYEHQGAWHDDAPRGPGKLIEEGNVLYGEFEKDILKEGFGRKIIKNILGFKDYEYRGSFRQGKFHDLGKLIFHMDSGEDLLVVADWQEGSIKSFFKNDIQLRYETAYQNFCGALNDMFINEKIDPEARKQQQKHYGIIIAILKERLTSKKILEKILATNGLPRAIKEAVNTLLKLDNAYEEVAKYAAKFQASHLAKKPLYDKCIHDYCSRGLLNFVKRLWLPGESIIGEGFVTLKSIFENTMPKQLKDYVLKNSITNLTLQFYTDMEKSLWVEPIVIDLFHRLVKFSNERLYKIKEAFKEEFLEEQTKFLQQIWAQYYATLKSPAQELLDQERIDLYCGCYVISLRQSKGLSKNELRNEINFVIEEEINFALGELLPWAKLSEIDKQNILSSHFNKKITASVSSRKLLQSMLVNILKNIKEKIAGEFVTKNNEIIMDAIKFFIKYYESDIFLKRNTINYEVAFNDFYKLMKYLLQLSKANPKARELNEYGIKTIKEFINNNERISELVDLLVDLNRKFTSLHKKLTNLFDPEKMPYAYEKVRILMGNIVKVLKDNALDSKAVENADIFKIEINILRSINDYLGLLRGLDYTWFIYNDDIRKLSSDTEIQERDSLLIALDKSTKYAENYRKLESKSFIQVSKFLKQGTRQKHYMLEVATSLMNLVKDGPKISVASKLQLREASAEILGKICESFVHFSSPLTYANPNQFIMDTEKTFLHILLNNDSIEVFRNKLKRISLYLQFRKVNELTVADALKMFQNEHVKAGQPELSQSECEALQKAYDKYESYFKKYIEGIFSKDKKEGYTVKKIVEETRVIAKQWIAGYEKLKLLAKDKNGVLCGKINQELIPKIIAGLAAILSLRASGCITRVNGSYELIENYEKTYLLKPNCIQILGIFRLLGVDLEYTLTKIAKHPLTIDRTKAETKADKINSVPQETIIDPKQKIQISSDRIKTTVRQDETQINKEEKIEYEFRENPRELANHLARILTGQGKSWATELLAGFFQLVGYKVTVACYSDYLTERDKRDFEDHLGPFEFRKTDYSTFIEMCWKLIKGPQGNRLDIIESIIRGDAIENSDDKASSDEEQILIIDEVDVFFNENFGRRLNPVKTFYTKAIQELHQFIWRRISEGLKEPGELLNEILNKLDAIGIQDKILKNLRNTELLKIHLDRMIVDALKIAGLKSITEYKRFIVEENTVRVNEEVGGKNTIWYYENSFFYLRFMYEKYKTFEGIHLDDSKYGYLLLDCGGISYAELPKQFKGIFGLSGSLPVYEEENPMLEMYKISKRSIPPSFYGSKIKLKFDKKEDFLIKETKKLWFEEIRIRVRQKVKEKRATLVFFDDDQMLEEFYKYHTGDLGTTPCYITKNYIADDGPKSRRRYTLGDIEQLIRLKPGQVILLTSEFGRGVDYKPDLEVIAKGGVHVIQTFFSDDEKEETQFKGRTARKDDPGSYELVLLLEKLKETFSLSASKIDLSATYDCLNQIREEHYKRTCKWRLEWAKDEKLVDLHSRTMTFLYDAASCTTDEQRVAFIKSIPGRKLH